MTSIKIISIVEKTTPKYLVLTTGKYGIRKLINSMISSTAKIIPAYKKTLFFKDGKFSSQVQH